jgi:hypothetical protein
MAYKPPGRRPARRNPPDRRARRTLTRQHTVRRSRTRTHNTGASGEPCGTSTQGWPGTSTTHGRCRGNAVGSPSVKVGAAPDTPPWGQVLARHLLRGRLHRRAGSVTLRQSSGQPLPLRIHETRRGLGQMEVGGGAGRATPAVWTRSATPAPATESGLILRSPAGGAGPGTGVGSGAGHDAQRMADICNTGPADSPGRDTGSTGRTRGRRPLPGKDPS